jgi:HPr Serine kinase C-terminal domain
MAELSSETLHASCVSIDNCAVLIMGPSGSGKSDLALRLIDRGADLVSDDYTVVRRVDGQLLAAAPSTIKDKIEMRGIGIVTIASHADVPVVLIVLLDQPVPRMPVSGEKRIISGIAVPMLALSAFEASTPIKVEHALRMDLTAL